MMLLNRSLSVASSSASSGVKRVSSTDQKKKPQESLMSRIGADLDKYQFIISIVYSNGLMIEREEKDMRN